MDREGRACHCKTCGGAVVPYWKWSRHSDRRTTNYVQTSFAEFLAQGVAAAGSSSTSSAAGSSSHPGMASATGSHHSEPGSSGSTTMLSTPQVEQSESTEDMMDTDSDRWMSPPPDLPSPDGSSTRDSLSDYGEVDNDPECLDALAAEDMIENIQEDHLDEPNPLRDGAVSDEEDMPSESLIEHIRITQQFIQLVKNASLDDACVPEEIRQQLRNPPTGLPDLSDPLTRYAIELYLATAKVSEQTYHDVRSAYLTLHPNTDLLSFHSVKKLITEITGIVTVTHDMCINSCHAYTGPWAESEECFYCGQPRYDQAIKELTGKKVPRLQFDTILLGPQLQARRRHPQTAAALRYRVEKLKEVNELLDRLTAEGDTNGSGFVYDDIMCGQAFRDLADRVGATEDDVAISLSIDGCQLYQNKKSDTWIWIWPIEDFAPDRRFKEKGVIPGGIIPGPNKPKHIDSFLFPSLHHIRSLQRENGGRGFACWDALKMCLILVRILFILATADRLGLTEIDGRVGHHGVLGCRSDCDMVGRHKPGSGHYYPAHLRPYDCSVQECSHPDIDMVNLSPPSTIRYNERLVRLVSSRTATEYTQNRKLTGISKPCILLGLDQRLMYPVPTCFSPDLMHLWYNVQELLISLWRGTIDCASTDSKDSWPWRKLIGSVWTEHGKRVAEATPYFPSCFHRPPRNPAEKISSGYKVTEYYLYMFGLGPGHFRAILPREYYRNFCKLVRGARLLNNRSITGSQVAEAHTLLVDFVQEYELLYYQRREDRLQFCCPCIHTLLHLGPETVRLGPGAYYTQYRLERTIGDLGSQIRLHSNPFANLARRAVQQAEINALGVICPEIGPRSSSIPKYAKDIGGGYLLLRKRDRRPQLIPGEAGNLIQRKYGIQRLRRWGRLRLPNGQVARSRWKEQGMTRTRIRISRNVKFQQGAETKYGEVLFYGIADGDSGTEMDSDTCATTSSQVFAVISVYSSPHQGLLQETSQVLWAFQHASEHTLQIVPVSDILSVVSVQPLPKQADLDDGYYFVVEKPGIDDLNFNGDAEVITET